MWATFLPMWLSSEWNESLRLAIDRYIDANEDASVELSTVKAVVGLEQLAWAFCMEHGGRDRQKFLSLPLHTRLEPLIGWAGLHRHIPRQLTSIKRHYKRGSHESAVHVLTQIRNGVVHAHVRERIVGLPLQVRFEARQVALWYLELCYYACLITMAGTTAGWILAIRLSRVNPYRGENPNVEGKVHRVHG